MKKNKIVKTKHLNIFGSDWKIQWVTGIIEDNGHTYSGMTWHSKKTVQVSVTDDDGKPIPKQEVGETLLHELMHASLGEGCYWDINTEPFVEWMAKCMYAIIKSKLL